MAFIIENGTAGILEIEDLGITLGIGEISDLSTRTSPQDVALSMESGEELYTLITVGFVIVKDPLDGVTNLSVANAIICLQAINDPHFRVGAGALIGDISDVDLSGLSDNFILEFDSSSGNWLATLNTGGTGISRAVADVVADTGSFAAVGEDTLNIVGGTNVTTTIAGDTLTINVTGSGVTELNDLTDVTITLPTITQKLQFNGSQWVNVEDVVPAPSGSEKSIQLKWSPIAPLSGTAEILITSSLPSFSEGIEIWNDTMDIQDANSTIRIATSVTFTASNAAMEPVFVIFRGTTPVGAALATNANKDKGSIMTFTIYDIPGVTGPTTYSLRVGKNGGPGTWYINTLPTPTNPLGGLLAQGAYTIEEIGVIQ